MARPTNRQEFKEFVLRKLGKGAICINVTDAQVEDRIDEALEYYWTFHFNGTRRVYLKHQVTQQDKDNRYIPIADGIEGVMGIFNVSSSNIASTNMFSARYQFVLNNLDNLANYDLTNYYLNLQHYSFMEEILVGEQPIDFNRFDDRLFIHTDWNRIPVGNWIVAEVFERIPESNKELWSDWWLQNYCAAKIKYMWGSILSKFEGVQLVGGVQFNGVQMMTDAENEVIRLEDMMHSDFKMPPRDFVG